MASSIRITGTRELQRKLMQAGPLATKAVAAAAVEEQEQVMSVAKSRTPVDTGTLRGSGTVLPPEVSGTRVKVVAGFGGAASAYALVQHERLDFHHTSGQAKFLESAFLERAMVMPRTLAAGVERALRRLGG